MKIWLKRQCKNLIKSGRCRHRRRCWRHRWLRRNKFKCMQCLHCCTKQQQVVLIKFNNTKCFLTGIEVKLCWIFLQFSWCLIFFLCGIVFKSFLAQRHWQTHTNNKQSWTHTHALNYSFSCCCWLILWLTNYPRRATATSAAVEAAKLLSVPQIPLFHIWFSLSMRVLIGMWTCFFTCFIPMPTVSRLPSGVCFLIEPQSESKSTTCVCLSLLHTHTLSNSCSCALGDKEYFDKNNKKKNNALSKH